MSKKQVKIDADEIKKTIKQGDNIDGHWILAVSPSGEWSIHWASKTRAWDSWGDDDAIMSIPALIPEGDGEYWQEMEDSYHWGEDGAPAKDAVQEMVDDGEFWGHAEWIEENDPNWYADYESEAVDWLGQAFESALNGFGDDLNDPDPWREQEINGMSPEDLFEFEIV